MQRTLLAAALTLLATHAAAWGAIGHRAVGRIAERHLSAEAAREVTALLAPERLAHVGTWADEIRSDPEWAKAESWHWVTLPPGRSYAQTEKNPTGDVLEAIARFERTLADRRAPAKERTQALKWLVHLVGDIHQPLHVGRGDDRGGNDHVVLWFNEPSNLHYVWDGGMVDRAQLSFSELAEKVDVASREDVRAWQAATPLDWAEESRALLGGVYEVGDRRLSWRYSFKHWPTVERRLNQAGVRLAGLFNRLLGAEPSSPGAWSR